MTIFVNECSQSKGRGLKHHTADLIPLRSPIHALSCDGLTLQTNLECGDVPLLTPGSKEMMSQALKATFSGFTKEQQRLGIPK
ncbi:protein C-ets-1 isoform X1, partial [Tachysurus ichikawai]